MDVAFFTVYVGQGPRTARGKTAKADAMKKFAAIHRMAEQMYPNLIEIAYTPDDASASTSPASSSPRSASRTAG